MVKRLKDKDLAKQAVKDLEKLLAQEVKLFQEANRNLRPTNHDEIKKIHSSRQEHIAYLERIRAAIRIHYKAKYMVHVPQKNKAFTRGRLLIMLTVVFLLLGLGAVALFYIFMPK